MAGRQPNEKTPPPSPGTMKRLHQKRYQHPQKMEPGMAQTAKQVCSPHRNSVTNGHRRKFCAVDWCTQNPNGSVGDFNLYWDGLSKQPEVLAVC